MALIDRSPRIFAAALILLATGAFLTILWLTPHGIGLTADSVMYIGGARGLLAHRGFGLIGDDGWYGPIVTYTPAFPAIAALVASTGMEILKAAQYVECSLFSLNAILVGLLIWFNTSRSTLAALFGVILFCLSPAVLGIHTYAYSEPLFIFCVLAAIGILASTIKRPRFGKTIAAGACLGCAYLARYAALAFVGSCTLTILLLIPGSKRRRISHAVLLLVSCVPFIIPWMARIHQLHVSAVGRSFGWHPVSAECLRLGAQTVFRWAVPLALAGSPIAWVVYGIALLAGIVGWLKMRKRVGTAPAQPKVFSPLLWLAAMGATVYCLFLIVSISLFDGQIPLDQRILAPLYICLLVGAIVRIAGARRKVWQYAFLPALVALLLLYGWADSIEAKAMRLDGNGYASVLWQNSETMLALRRIPSGTLIYSNGWDVIHLYTGRHAELLPYKSHVGREGIGVPSSAEMQSLDDQLKARTAVIVYLRHSRRGEQFLTEADLMQQLSIRRLVQCSDGAIYVWQRKPRGTGDAN